MFLSRYNYYYRLLLCINWNPYQQRMFFFYLFIRNDEGDTIKFIDVGLLETVDYFNVSIFVFNTNTFKVLISVTHPVK